MPTHHLFSLLLLLLPLFSQSARGGEPMRSLTIYEGLAGESVYDICQTSDGVVWFATTNGVTSYDGNEAVTYRTAGERKTLITSLAATRDGRLWAGSARGLLLVDAQRNGLTLASNDMTCRINCLATLGDTVLAGTDNGLYVYDGRHARQLCPVSNRLSTANRIQDVEVDARGTVWALGDGELYRVNIGSGRFQAMGVGGTAGAGGDLRVMAVTSQRVFLGTYNHGLYAYIIKERRAAPYLDVGCRVITCLSAKQGRLYVGTDGAGLNIVSLAADKSVAVYNMDAASRYQLLDNTVYSFLCTSGGVCFFGYYRRGVQHNYHVQRLFHCYRSGAFNSRGVNIRSFSIADDIKVLGSRGGLYLIDERRGRHKFFSPAELGGSIVTNVVRYGEAFYCTMFNGGVMRIDPENLRASRIGTNPALRWGSFGSLAVSPDDELWMSGNAGIFVYNRHTGRFRVYNSHNSRLSSGYINNLLFDRQGRCWISSANGLALYDPSTSTIQTQGFPTGFFNRVAETTAVLGDKDNILFFSTDGMYRTNEELTLFGSIDTRETIGNDYVSQVAYDPRHRHYWIATERGMFRLDAAFLNVAKFAQQTGLDAREFSNGAICIDKHRRLWTGTVGGLFYASLDELARYSTGRQMVSLSAATRAGRPFTLAEHERMLSERELSLGYNFGTETLSFLPMLLDFSDPNGQCYEWRLGHKGGWHVLKNRAPATLEHGFWLGRNTLEVRLAGQPHATRYTVYVWPTATFIAEVLAILALIVASVVAVRQRLALRRGRKEMERVRRELDETRRKYARVTTSDIEQERLARRLEAYMRQEKPFLDADLRLSDVAARLECSTVKLSQYFNQYQQVGYYDYLNRLRLEEFKRRLDDRRYANYTLLALAEECGFRRSAFFATFKKFEGVTPTEYVKRLRQA